MRALLLDAGAGQAAASAARRLVAAGWTVGLAAPGAAVLRRSRAVAADHVVPWPASGVEVALTAVEEVVARHGYDVVLPCGDDWVALLDRPTSLVWRVEGTEDGAATRCLDKVELHEAAGAVGLRSPRTVAVDGDAMTDWDGPAVVKARSHWLPEHDDPRQRLEARFVPAVQDAREFAVAADRAGGAAVLQEPVAGSLGAVVGLVHEGRFLRVAQQRADLGWPLPMGITARAETVVADPALVERAGALVQHLGYEGLVQVEFLHPDDGGEPVVIDVNPRCYGSLALAEAAGLELVAAWARWLATGEVPSRRSAPAGARYLWTEGALRAALQTSRPGDGPARSAAAVAGVLRDACTATHPTWHPRDPVPAVLLWLRLLRRAASSLVGRA